MGGTIFTIFLIIIVLNFLSSVGEKQLNNKKNANPWKNTQSSSGTQDEAIAALKARAAARQQSFSKKNSGQTPRHAARYATRKAGAMASRKLKDLMDDRASKRKDANDKNRSRIANWGERAGPGILTLSNIFILVILLILGLYVWDMIQGSR